MNFKRSRRSQRGRSRWVMGLGGVALALLVSGCQQVLEQLPPLPQVEIPEIPGRRSLPRLDRPIQSETTAEIEAAVREQINLVRQEYGLSPLSHNEQLAVVARNYSQQMAEQEFFSHTGADGSTLSERVRDGGVRYRVVGENLFMGRNVAEPVPVAVEGWMDSPGHRENILRPVFTETGIGVWRLDNRYYITQLFLRP